MSRLITNAIRSTSASTDAITMDGSGNVTFPANATCSGTATGFGGGKLLQVIQTVKTDTSSYLSVAHTAFTADVMTATITPSSSSNKILVSCVICFQVSTTDAGFKLNRDGTDICIGNSSGSRRPVTIAATQSSSNEMFNLFAEFLDSPNTTSATTYGVKLTHGSSGSADIFVNQMNEANDDRIMRPTSMITLKEVAA